MDSDGNSSYNSLDEIFNNLEDSASDGRPISDSENTNLAKSSIQSVDANSITLLDVATIGSENTDKIGDFSDKSADDENIVNSNDSRVDYPATVTKDIEDQCKYENVSKEMNLDREIQNAEENDNFLINKSDNPKIDPISTDGQKEFEKRSFNNITKNNTEFLSSEKYKDGCIITQFLDNSQVDAEARLAARRAARAEAREIRMREVERQQREQEENADRQFDMQEPMLMATSGAVSRTSAATAMLRTTPSLRLTPGSAGSYLSSRRSSEDSLEDTGNLRDLRHELKDVEEKFRKAMIANAQLDNDKSSQTYQLELLKDRIEDLEEAHAQLRREHRDKCRDYDQLQRQTDRLKQDLSAFRAQLEDRDRLIADKGLVIVGGEDDLSEDGSYLETSLLAGNNISGMVNGGSTPKRALVSIENAQMLEHAGEGSLDVRLARFAKDRSEFQDIISHLKLELEEERNRRRKNSGVLNGPTTDSDFDDQHRVASKQLDDYKFRAQKAEQDVATLQANVARLESQVIRYKSAAEASEKSEEALKTEKRKLQREARDAQSRAEELETANTHLIKRLDKLKTAKSALLKEL